MHEFFTVRIFFTLCTFFIYSSVFAFSKSQKFETEYNYYLNQLLFKKELKLKKTASQSRRGGFQNPALAALWDVVNKEVPLLESINNPLAVLAEFDDEQLTIQDKTYLFILKRNFLFRRNPTFIRELNEKILSQKIDNSTIYILLSNYELFEQEGIKFENIKKNYGRTVTMFNNISTKFRDKSKRELKDLFYFRPRFENYLNREYEEGIKLFMFCRKNRSYPCLMLMKDSQNQIVMSSKNEIWHQPSLGLSKRGKPFNKKNGSTPSGAWLINGVMPKANRKLVYGDYRRLILDFPSRSAGEKIYKKLLPSSAHDKLWWQEAVIARDIGRSLFRIHGTKLKNTNEESSYYPFVPTSGCVAQRENRYDFVTYKDQRKLLDQAMLASQLPPIFDNETKIRGILYVINIDDQKRAVAFSDIQKILDL